MFWTASLSRTILSRLSSCGSRSVQHQLHVVRVCHPSQRCNFTLEMKRNAEESTDVDRSFKAAKFNATQPEAGSSSSPAGKSTQQADQKQEKKKGRAWKDKGSVKVGRRGRRREEPAEGEESTEPKALRLPKRQCALLIGFCGTGYSGMQLYSTRLLHHRNNCTDCVLLLPVSPVFLEPSKVPYSMPWSKPVLYLQTTPMIQSR
jgi:hypothetical protein